MRSILLLACIFRVTLSAKAQIFDFPSWQNGSYYDIAGQKHTGQIKKPDIHKNLITTGGTYIYYRASEKSDDQKLYAKDIKSLIVDRDSFVVTHVPELEKTPFLSVVFDKNIKIYNVRVSKNSGTGGAGAVGFSFSYNKNFYYYGPDAENLTKLERSKFVKVMSQIMSDKPEVVERIKANAFSYADMKELIEYYNTGIIPKWAAKDETETEQ